MVPNALLPGGGLPLTRLYPDNPPLEDRMTLELSSA